MLRDQAVEVPRIFASVVDRPVDSDRLVLSNPVADRPQVEPGQGAANL